MKKSLIPLVFVGILYQGCTNTVVQPNTPVKFYTPSKLSVMKEGSKIYIQNLHNHKYKSKNLVKNIKSYFQKDKVYQVVNKMKNTDYVISINTFYSYRGDTRKESKYNKKYSVKREVYRDSKGRETGGKDKIISSNYSASTGTLITTVSIYDKKNLEPLYYFNISPSDTSKAASRANYTSSSSFSKKFTEEVVVKINDLLTKKDKKVNVFLPNKSAPTLKASLLNANFTQLFKDSKNILPVFDFEEVSLAKYEEIDKKASVKDSKVQKRNLEFDLANFYLYFMAKESSDISAKNIKNVFNAYKKIMFLTKDESLLLACANSLGRIEFKADRLNINLGAQ